LAVESIEPRPQGWGLYVPKAEGRHCSFGPTFPSMPKVVQHLPRIAECSGTQIIPWHEDGLSENLEVKCTWHRASSMPSCSSRLPKTTKNHKQAKKTQVSTPTKAKLYCCVLCP